MNKELRPLLPKNSGLLIELVGPAGAGKTTVARLLRQHSAHFVSGAEIELRKATQAPLFLRTLVGLIPLILRSWEEDRTFSWDEIKMLAYLQGWQHIFQQQAAPKDARVLLDHGPVFQLATLHGFGPRWLQTALAQPWWQARFAQWAGLLDLVIWLDAPDAVLEKRINLRTQRHQVKGKSAAEVAQFLANYRLAYDRVLGQITADGGPMVLHYDTSQTTSEQILAEVLTVCALHPVNPVGTTPTAQVASGLVTL